MAAPVDSPSVPNPRLTRRTEASIGRGSITPTYPRSLVNQKDVGQAQGVCIQLKISSGSGIQIILGRRVGGGCDYDYDAERSGHDGIR